MPSVILIQLAHPDNAFLIDIDTFATELLHQAPHSSNVWYVRAKIAQAHSDWNAAILLFEQTLQEKGLFEEWQPRLFEHLASAYYAKGEYQKALENLRITARLEPTNNAIRKKMVDFHLR